MGKHIPDVQRVSFSIVTSFSIAVATAPGFAQAQQNFLSKPIRLLAGMIAK